MNAKIPSFVLLVCATVPFVRAHHYSQESVRSNVFEPLRPKHAPKVITECEQVITEAYGLLETSYKSGQGKQGSSCSWTLKAPANHVINVISVSFDLLDRTPSEIDYNDYSGSLITLHDGTNPNSILAQYTVNEKQHVGAFVSSITSQPEMLVKVEYRDNKDHATQKMAIKYEFLNVDDMNRMLRERANQ